MKKLLALVLALVMSMSLVTISNAAFKDADKISNKEAVEVMAAVGVLAGYDNGEFGATDTLTRAQACKIIAYLDLGKDVAEALPPFRSSPTCPPTTGLRSTLRTARMPVMSPAWATTSSLPTRRSPAISSARCSSALSVMTLPSKR